MIKNRLGDLLIDAGLLDEDKLKKALEIQRTTGRRLGEILIENGLVTETDVAQAVSRQLRIPFLRIGEVRVDPEAASLVNEQTARRHKALPIGKKDSRLLVAMSDPLNVYAIEDIQLITGLQVEPVMMLQKEVDRLIQQFYQLEWMREEARVEAPPRPAPLREVGEDVPAVRLVSNLIERALEEGATDIHIEPWEGGLRVRQRVDGVLHEVMAPPKGMHAAVVSRIKIMASMDISEHRLPQDGRIELKDAGRDADLRVSTLPTIYGEKVVIRILDRARAITSLEDLGLSAESLERYRSMIQKPWGMVLVTGPTGSGKTTTLTATLHELNDPGKNIITVEDPVEYTIPGVNQVQVNPKAGLSFASGLRSILRQDPNIIMVGEIRDSETADIAIRAALTGHLVFSTLHTNDAAGALARLVDMGIEPFLIASSVIGVVAQRLARTLCKRCRVPYELVPDDPERLGLPLPEGPFKLFRAGSCPACSGSGYRGRAAVFEVLTVTNRIRELVTRKAPSHEIKRTAVEEGMNSLLQDGVEKALKGVTTLEEVRRVAFSEES